MDWANIAWTLFGLVIFGACFYFTAKMIRDKGNSGLSEWLREKWPKK